MRRVCFYCRVSSEEQTKKGLSIPAQIEKLQEWATKNNYKVVDTYIDDGVSAKKGNLRKRTELLRLLEDAKNERFDIVAFTMLDRFTRINQDYYYINDILESHGIAWDAILEDYNTRTSAGKLALGIMLNVKEYELNAISDRIKTVFDNKIKNGTVLSGSLPIGYKIENKKMVVDEEMAPVVRFIFDEYSKVPIKRGLILKLQKKFCYSPSMQTLSNILKNKLYIGEYRGNDNFCEPLVSHEVFEKCNHQKNVKSYNSHTYIFSGLLVCEKCGNRLIGTGRSFNKNGHHYSYRYYRCSKVRDHACANKKVVSENRLERYLLANVQEQFKIKNKKYEIYEQKNKFKKSTASIQKKINRINEMCINDLISVAEAKKKIEPLKLEIEKIKNENKENDIEKIKKISSALNAGFVDSYELLDREHRLAFWKSIIKEIVINNGAVVNVIFNV